MKPFLLLGALILISIIIYYYFSKRKSSKIPKSLSNIREILMKDVTYYQDLEDDEKHRFEIAINNFINRVTIEFIGLEENDEDKVFIASSAIIPIFRFGDWQYPNLTNVILYPDTFNHEFQFDQGDRSILGMVGNGYLNGQMVLSQKALRKGFLNPDSKGNTGIHEFVHLLDKSDGAVDGIPSLLLDKPYILPWIKVMHEEIKKINSGHSDINPYGSTNESEFLAVVAEYFFTQPVKMQQKHPDLYRLLAKAFGEAS